jgi:arylformamidase
MIGSPERANNFMVYKQFDQAALNSQYNNRLHVPDFASYMERWDLFSRQAEKELKPIKDVSYGSLPREQLYIYPSPHPSSKSLVFIHGGFWHRPGKEDFQFVARAFCAYGITTVLINYPLAPDVSMDQIFASCRRAIDWLYHNLPRYNGDPAQIYISGYSAGAHLAAMLLTTDWKQFNLMPDLIKGACLVSGLFNLIPIRLSDLNQVLQMSTEESLRNSPVQYAPATPSPVSIAVGVDETNEFLDQSRELYSCWKDKIPVELLPIEGLNHYSIMETALDPESKLHQAICRLMKIG